MTIAALAGPGMPAVATASDPEVTSSLVAEALRPADFHGFLLGKTDSVLSLPDSAFAREIDNQFVVGEHRRMVLSRDYRRTIQVELVHWRSRRVAEAMTNPKGSPDRAPPTLPPGAIATVGTIEPEFAERAALFYVGPVSVRVQVVVAGPRASARAGQLLERAAALQARRLRRHPDGTLNTLESSSLKRAMTKAVVVSLLLTMLVAALLTALRDPSVRRGWRLRFSDRPALPAHALDLTALATVLRRRVAIKSVIRAAVTVGAVAIAMVLPLDTLRSIGLVAAVLLVWTWIEGRPGYLKQGQPYIPPLFRGWAFPIGVLGTGLTIVLAGIGLAAVWLGILFQIFGLPGATAEQLGAFRLLLLLIGLGFVLLSVVPTQLVRRVAMRRFSKQIDKDPRPPVLLLRSFADDAMKLRARRARRNSPLDRLALRRWERFEEILAAQLGHVGPVEALGEPGTRLPPLGAARRTYPMTDWQAGVREQIAGAVLVVVNLGRSSALRWEIETIRELGALDRTVFVIPPSTRDDRALRLTALATVLDVNPKLLDFERPGLEILAVLLPNRDRPVLVTAALRDDISYELALEAAERTLAEYRAGAVLAAPPRVGVDAAAAKPADELFYAPGKAPRVRPWYRRFWVPAALFGMVSWVLLPLFAKTGTPLDEVDRVVKLRAETRVLLPERDADTAIAVQEGGGHNVDIVRVDPGSGASRKLGSLGLVAQDGASGEGWVVLTAAQDDKVSGFQPATGRNWTVRAGDTPRGVVVSDGRAYVALADDDAVVELDLTSGRELRRVRLADAPWGVAVRGDDLLVTLAAADTMVVLDKATLAVRARDGTPSSPREVFVTGGWTWLVGAEVGVLWRVSADGLPSGHVDCDTLFPTLAYGGDHVAVVTGDGTDIEAFEDTTGDHPIHLHFEDEIRRVAVTRNGKLLIAVHGKVGLGVVDL